MSATRGTLTNYEVSVYVKSSNRSLYADTMLPVAIDAQLVPAPEEKIFERLAESSIPLQAVTLIEPLTSLVMNPTNEHPTWDIPLSDIYDLAKVLCDSQYWSLPGEDDENVLAVSENSPVVGALEVTQRLEEVIEYVRSAEYIQLEESDGLSLISLLVPPNELASVTTMVADQLLLNEDLTQSLKELFRLMRTIPSDDQRLVDFASGYMISYPFPG